MDLRGLALNIKGLRELILISRAYAHTDSHNTHAHTTYLFSLHIISVTLITDKFLDSVVVFEHLARRCEK